MYLRSLDKCLLRIGSYPPFEYDATNGGGAAFILSKEQATTKYLRFDSNTFKIPPLTWKNTKFLCLPFPPGLKIEMLMDKLAGTWDHATGNLSLDFEARFVFSIFRIFHFPSLLIRSSLVTGKVIGSCFEEEGNVINANGRTKLVGIAVVPPTGNKILDAFLGLPNEALAVLNCEINGC